MTDTHTPSGLERLRAELLGLFEILPPRGAATAKTTGPKGG